MPGVFPGNQPMSPMNACGAMPAYPAGTPMSFAPSQGVGLPTMGMTGTYPPQASQQTPMGPPHMSGPSQRVSQPCNMGMPQTSNIPQGNFSQFGAAAFASALDAGSVPQQQQEFPSAFSVLGKTVPERSQNPENSQDVLLKALHMAITGDRRNPPSWSGAAENLRPWLKQLGFWELDNQTPRNKWGLKLLQAFPEGTPPRRIAESIDTQVLLSEAGYSSILSQIMAGYAPFLEAVGPASIDHFFFGIERGKNETFSTYITAMETALQEVFNNTGERIPTKIAGRILLKHANLTDLQRENLAIKHNALLSFEAVSRALRPLDRPEALLQKVSKHFLVADHPSQQHASGEFDDEEMIPDQGDAAEDSDDLQSDGEGGLAELMFDPEREYDESEIQYIWAYNMAYKDVRKEMQARRKGRQFFKPKGKEKGKGKSKKSDGWKDKKKYRGSPEELLARTRCFSCHEMGHIAKDCPNKSKGGGSAASGTSYFVSQGPYGRINSIYHTRCMSAFVGVSSELQRTLTIYAGVRVNSNEALVDTAAEEAVIGSNAMQRLKHTLAQRGLQPCQAAGASVNCAGIGGSANIVGLWDVPISVAKTPGLLRVTETADSETFETPFLLPVSYLELLDAEINLKREVLKLGNGRSTPMRRTPSGHRAVLVTDFSGRWKLPENLREELQLGQEDPFLLEARSTSKGPRQAPGVAVWLKMADGKLNFINKIGMQTSLIHPKDVLSEDQCKHIATCRTSIMHFPDGQTYSVKDVWNARASQDRKFQSWHGEVFFEEAIIPKVDESSVQDIGQSMSLDQARTDGSRVLQCVDKNQDSSINKIGKIVHESHESPLSNASPPHAEFQSQVVTDSQHRDSDSNHEHEKSNRETAAIPRAGSPSGSKDGSSQVSAGMEPYGSSDFHYDGVGAETIGVGSRSEPQPSDRGRASPTSQDIHIKSLSQEQVAPKHRTPTGPFHRLQELVLRSIHLCSRRRSASPKGHQRFLLVDMPGVWKQVGTTGMVRGCRESERKCQFKFSDRELQGQDSLSQCAASSEGSQGPSSVDSGRNPGTCQGTGRNQFESQCPNDQISHSSERQETGIQGCSTQESSTIDESQSRKRGTGTTTAGILDSKNSTNAHDTTRSFTCVDRAADDTSIAEKQKHVQWCEANEGEISTSDTSIREECGGFRNSFVGRRVQEQDPSQSRQRVHSAEPIKPSLGSSVTMRREVHTNRTTKVKPKAASVFIAAVVISWFGRAETQPDHLDWLGPRFSLNGHNDLPGNQYQVLLTHSTQELCRTDFEGTPAFVTRDDRRLLARRLRSYLSDVGEVYSPPRLTSQASKHGLSGRMAMDLTTGWNFCLRNHRKQALEMINRVRPAVIMLSPPCTVFSQLRSLSDAKRSKEVVNSERQEGLQHWKFALAIAKAQHENGRGFILEHPLGASSWHQQDTHSLAKLPGVYRICLDQCEFGLTIATGPDVGCPAKKPTMFLTNVEHLADFVERRCSKTHRHGQLLGGTAKAAEIYPPDLVTSILKGIKHALKLSQAEDGGKFFTRGRSLGSCTWEYAQEILDVEECERQGMDIYLQSTFPTRRNGRLPTIAEDSTEVDDEVVAEVQNQLRDVSQNQNVESALAKVEDFRKVDDEEFSLAPQLRREVHRLHRNLGHPAKEVFLRALKHAGVRQEVMDWTRRFFRCPTCESQPRPTSARPGHLSRALEFNMVVGVDLCFFRFNDETITLLNCLCWGSNFQIVAICPGRTAEDVSVTFWNEWIKHYGAPQLIIADRGSEFLSETFQEAIGGFGIAIHYTDPESPWQNGRTEKAGGIFKDKLKAVTDQMSIHREELPVAVAEVNAARNRFMDRYGFSPMQRVFGKNLRFPASLLSSDVLNQELVDASASDPIQRIWNIRECASQAWMKRQDKEAIQRSLRANTRSADAKPLHPGMWVYVYRDNASYRGWTGPGVLIAETETHRSWWISMRGRLWKASREQIRIATAEEQLGAELVTELSKDMLEKVERQGQLAYQDITHENVPNEDENPDGLVRVLRIVEQQAPDAQADQDVQPDDESTRIGSEGAVETATEMPEDVSRRTSIVDVPSEVAAETSNPVDFQNHPGHRRIMVDEGNYGRMSLGPMPRPMPYPHVSPPPSLPSPPGRTYYVEVTNFDKEDVLKELGVKHKFVGATWKFSRQHHCTQLQQHPEYTYTFDSSQAEASYHFRDKCMYVTKAKTSFGQVEFRNLNEKEKEIFRAARKKEMDSLIANGAVRVLSIEESEKFRQEFPKQIIESRFVDRYKPKEIDPKSLELYKRRALEEGRMETIPLEKDHTSPKSRWCCVGWRDPDVHEVERSAPTPLSSSLYCCFQLAASRRWRARIKDVKTAFLQSLPTTRQRKLACRQPRDEPLPGLHPSQLILLLTEVYGLVSGPSWWRRSLVKVITETLGYKMNEYDKCVATLPSTDQSKDAKTEGFLVIEVDDIAEAGGPRHQQKMQELEQKLKFGKIEELYNNPDGCMYAGRHIQQLADFSFEHHMDEYIYTRLEPISISRKVFKKDAPKVKLDEREKSQLRGLIASLNWTAREGRPDASATASILATTFPEPCMSHVFQANDMVAHLKTFPTRLKIHAIPEDKLRNLLISDSAFDTTGKEKSQFGFLLGFTDPTMNEGKLAPVSLMQWKSKRLRRKASSSLLCESISFSAGTGALERQDAFMASIRFSNFRPRDRQKSEDEVLSLMGKASVIADESLEYRDPRSLAVADAKALYDSLASEQSHGGDDRAALEVAIIKESLIAVGGRARWVPHNLNPADALTKAEEAHSEPLLKLMKQNAYQIEEEEQVLSRGKQSDHRQKISHSAAGTLSFGG